MLVGNEVRSVDRAASLLIALGESQGDAGVTELARRLELHKSTASRLLATLQKHGLVERNDESGKYRLGLAVIRLGGHAEQSLDLHAIAAPELEELARSVHETASLECCEGDIAVTIAYADSSGICRDRQGRTSPLHASATGKILLASKPEREIMRLSRSTFTAFTPHTIVRVDLLLEELARVRTRGFSTAFGEHEASVNAIAVPVFDHRTSVVAALGLRAAGNRITPSRVFELVARARESAAIISDRIGGL